MHLRVMPNRHVGEGCSNDTLQQHHGRETQKRQKSHDIRNRGNERARGQRRIRAQPVQPDWNQDPGQTRSLSFFAPFSNAGDVGL